MVTPFLKPLSAEGGSLYVFPSASMDLTRTFVSNEYEFKFSHFACLNIPNIYSGSYTAGDPKGMYISTLLGNEAVNQLTPWNSDTMGKVLVENLQNYVMNFEVAILNGEGDNDEYDSDILTTVSEKVFFNWLRKVGGIEFNGREEDYASLSERTVQYIGNLDMMNTVEVNGDVFNELYIHIPSTVGASTRVYFRDGDETDNKNYLDKRYPLGGRDPETTIIGRGDSCYPYYESGISLSLEPIFDEDAGTNTYVGDIGHTIDFRNSSYADGLGLSVMNNESSESFEFNAVLIYYDLLEKTKTPGVKKQATNLYGILFLDNITDMNISNSSTDNTNDNEAQGFIQRYPKIKETIYGNGNSFALKVDLKVDTTPDTSSSVIKYVDPNSVIAMSLYERALVQMQKCIQRFFDQEKEIKELRERINNLETMVIGLDTVDTLRGEIDRLYNLYDGTSAVDNDTVLKLIEINSKKLDTIMHGGKNVKLQYDTDVIQAGSGISVDKSLNKVVISAGQGYSINKAYEDASYTLEISDENPIDPTLELFDCYIKLMSGDNLSVIYIDDAGEYRGAIKIHIDESDHTWKTGQTMRLFFLAAGDDETLNLEDSYGIEIYNGDVGVCTISPEELTGVKVVEIICLGENKFIYSITK